MARSNGRKRKDRARAAQLVKQETLAQAYARFDQVNDSARETVVPREAYQLSAWVYGAITQIAGTIAQIPFVVKDRDNTVAGTPLNKFIDSPNPYDQQDTSAKFRNVYLTELLLNGSVMRVLVDMVGMLPTGMICHPRWKFTPDVRWDTNGMMFAYRWRMNRPGSVSRIFVPGDDIYHDALFNPYHDFEGLSPLTAALVGIGNDINSGEFANRFYLNDSSSGIVFTSEHPAFTQDKADVAQKKWREQHDGVKQAFGAKFVGFGLKPQTIGQPFDAKAHQILKAVTKEEIVTGIFKIPLEIFGVDKETSGVVIGDRQKDTAQESFLVNVVQPWSRRYDEDFNKDVTWRFGSQYKCVHDFETHPLLERRKLERARAACELIDRGVTMNDVIKWLKLQLEPKSWGNEWWVPSNTIPASVIQDAGERALFDRAPSASNAGGKNGKPGNRDNNGNRRQALDDYADSIMQLAATTGVKNSIHQNGTGAHRLVEVLKELNL